MPSPSDQNSEDGESPWPWWLLGVRVRLARVGVWRDELGEGRAQTAQKRSRRQRKAALGVSLGPRGLRRRHEAAHSGPRCCPGHKAPCLTPSTVGQTASSSSTPRVLTLAQTHQPPQATHRSSSPPLGPWEVRAGTAPHPGPPAKGRGGLLVLEAKRLREKRHQEAWWVPKLSPGTEDQ